MLGSKAGGDVDSTGGEAEAGAADDRYVVRFGDSDHVTDEAVVESRSIKRLFKVNAEETAVERSVFAAVVGWVIREAGI